MRKKIEKRCVRLRGRRTPAVWLALALAAICAFSGVLAEDSAEGDFPALNEAGFLDSGEFVWEDETNGVWR